MKVNYNWRNPKTVITDYKTVPKEIVKSNKNNNISGDIIIVNKIPFFETISHNLNFTTI